MENSSKYPDMIKSGMKKKKRYQGAIEGNPDPGFLRDMGYLNKKKKKGGKSDAS